VPSNNNLRIAIIGGGPGGLSLARLLHLKNILFIVLEHDTSPSTRGQGGTLDLHQHTGQCLLKEARLWDTVQSKLRYEGEAMAIVDPKNNRLYEKIPRPAALSDDPGSGRRPEIDRAELRRVLIESIPPETIRWGAHVDSVTEDGKIQLQGGEELSGFDIIVGADGAWSKVRALLSGAVPMYAGLSGVDLRLFDADKSHPEVSKLVGNGGLCALGDNLAILPQRNGDGSIRVYAWGRRPQDWIDTCGIDFKNPASIKAGLLKEYADWAPELQRIIKDASEDLVNMVPRALYTLPADHRWETRPNFTLIGDAAHLMLPSGEGVNLAMIDALELAEAIGAANAQKAFGEGLKKFIGEYEAKMWERSQAAAEKARRLNEIMFSEGAAATFAEWFKTMMAKALVAQAAAGAASGN
jgi:2-polyprenyl-6-methoxyphenol hydroxylase-like FAD-dependent oxidoreductase